MACPSTTAGAPASGLRRSRPRSAPGRATGWHSIPGWRRSRCRTGGPATSRPAPRRRSRRRRPVPRAARGRGPGPCSAVVPLHEHELLEQGQVLFVLQQCADQRRDADLLVLCLQGLGRDILGQQQLEPVDQLRGARFLLQAGQVAHRVEVLQRGGEQVGLQGREMHADDLGHRFGIGELDVVEEAAAQERVRQLLLIVGRDEDQRPVLGLDQLARLVHVELHPVDFAQQVVRELDVGLVDLVDQQHHGPVGLEGLPEHALDDVVLDVADAVAAFDAGELRVPQTADGVVLVQALLGLGGALDMPLQQRHVECGSDLLGQHRLAGAGLALDQQRALQCGRGMHREHQVGRGDVLVGTLKFHRENRGLEEAGSV
mmetsp:Transcript_1095/g.2970  ORF Transcript_1095/g.2970 Transcript_1095/m.2970 type:complete len:373 (+) Transcript_1095:740-1858(+)